MPRPRRPRRVPRPFRPRLERLEDRLAPSLVPHGPPLDVSDAGAGGQTTGYGRTVAQAADGHFVAVWQDNGIRARLFNADGTPRTGEMLVPFTSGVDAEPTVAMNAAGQFVVAWTRRWSPDNRDIIVQAYNESGGLYLGPTFVALTASDEFAPSIGMASTGNYDFAVAYTLRASPTDLDVEVARRTNVEVELNRWGVATSLRNESAPSLAMT